MLDIYLKALRSALPFIVPMVIVSLLVGIWTHRYAKRKQSEMLKMMTQQSPPDPLTEAQSRYAKGEITQQEYESIKANLEK